MIATLCSLRYVKDIPFTRFRSGSKEFNVSMSFFKTFSMERRERNYYKTFKVAQMSICY